MIEEIRQALKEREQRIAEEEKERKRREQEKQRIRQAWDEILDSLEEALAPLLGESFHVTRDEDRLEVFATGYLVVSCWLAFDLDDTPFMAAGIFMGMGKEFEGFHAFWSDTSSSFEGYQITIGGDNTFPINLKVAADAVRGKSSTLGCHRVGIKERFLWLIKESL